MLRLFVCCVEKRQHAYGTDTSVFRLSKLPGAVRSDLRKILGSAVSVFGFKVQRENDFETFWAFLSQNFYYLLILLHEQIVDNVFCPIVKCHVSLKI